MSIQHFNITYSYFDDPTLRSGRIAICETAEEQEQALDDDSVCWVDVSLRRAMRDMGDMIMHTVETANGEVTVRPHPYTE
jgi:hypothetical protein